MSDNKSVVIAPLTGEIHHLVTLPDLVFSRKLTGDGIAIKPTDNTVVAPFDGEVIQLLPTLHAIGIRSNTGLEVLIHVGINTVGLKGEGFEAFVQAGDKVKQGDTLITFDLDIVKDKAKSTLTPIIVTNGKKFSELDLTTELNVVAGSSTLITTEAK